MNKQILGFVAKRNNESSQKRSFTIIKNTNTYKLNIIIKVFALALLYFLGVFTTNVSKTAFLYFVYGNSLG